MKNPNPTKWEQMETEFEGYNQRGKDIRERMKEWGVKI